MLIYGVARKSGWGVPTLVLQEEVTDQNELEKVCGTVKDAVLKGNLECPNLCAISVYDTKQVHFITMCNEKLSG